MKRFTSERVVVTWGHPIAGSRHDRETTADYRKAAAELYRDLIEQFEHIDLLQFSAGKCVMRTVVMEGEDGFGAAKGIVAMLEERGIDEVEVRVVDIDQGTPLEDQLRQAAKVHGGTAFTDAADLIEKRRLRINRLRQRLIDATSAKAERYKHAATALWQALDSIAEIDSIGGDDARFRLDARQLAKLRLEHASKRGRELLWSWQSPLPPELLDLAAKDLHHKLHGPAPTFLERIGEAAKTATADKPAIVEVQPEQYDAADCIRVPPVEFPVTSVHHAKTPPVELPPEFYDGTSAAAEKGLTSDEVASALEHKGLLKPVQKIEARVDGNAIETVVHLRPDVADLLISEAAKPAIVELQAGQPIDSVGALTPDGLAGFEPYRGPLDEHTTEDERVRWCPDAKGEPDASAE